MNKKSITEIIEDLSAPVPDRFIDQRKQGGAKLSFVPWHRVQRVFNDVTNGHVDYEIRDREITDKYVMMSVRITVHAEEGTYFRDGSGIESLNTSSYGDPQSNAESMAFRRAAARFGYAIGLYENGNQNNMPTLPRFTASETRKLREAAEGKSLEAAREIMQSDDLTVDQMVAEIKALEDE